MQSFCMIQNTYELHKNNNERKNIYRPKPFNLEQMHSELHYASVKVRSERNYR